MALPSSGEISIEQIKAELGISGELNLTDSRVRALAGRPSGDVTLPNDLWGKSARSISIYIVSSRSVRVGGGSSNLYSDRIVFGIQITGGGTPSSYSWAGDVSGSGSTVTFSGPTYEIFGYTYQAFGTAYASVVIDGQTLSAELGFSYTAGDAF